MRVLTAEALLAGLLCLAQQAHGGASAMSNNIWQASTARPPSVTVESGALEPVAFAADELRKYLGEILGTPIKSGPAAGPSIELRVDDVKALGDEGYRIAVNDGTVTITGGGPAGVVYGAYYFLRKFGGCRFSGVGSDSEYVPRHKEISFAGPAVEMRPRLWYRGTQIGGSWNPDQLAFLVDWLDWMAKNGLNYVIHNPDPGPNSDWFDKHLAPELLRRGLKLDRNHHGFNSWLPTYQYFEKHPEYYALVDGKRVRDGKQLSICTSNPEAVAAFIANMKAYLRAHPAVKIIGVIPEDGYGMCDCDKCKAMDAELEHEAAPAISPESLKCLPMKRAKTRRYATFVNEVARAIRQEFPNVLVGSAAYVDLVWPDPVVRLEPNVVTWVAIYWRDGAHVLSADSPSAKNRAYFECLKMWRKLHRGKVIVYEYYMGMSSQKSLPYPQDRVILRDWPELESVGVKGATIQCMPDVTNAFGLNLITFARLAWEESVDPAALQAEYTQGMYGAAAEAVQPIYDAFHEAWRRAERGIGQLSDLRSQQETTVSPNGRDILLIMDVLGEDGLNKAIECARAAASNDRERRQVVTLGLQAEYWKQATRFYRLKDKAQAAEEKGDKQVAEDMKKQLEAQLKQVMECANRLPLGYAWSGTNRMWARELQSK